MANNCSSTQTNSVMHSPQMRVGHYMNVHPVSVSTNEMLSSDWRGDTTGVCVVGGTFAERSLLPQHKPDYHAHIIVVILTYRTWAIWESDWRMTYGLFAALGLTWSVELILMALFQKTVARESQSSRPCAVSYSLLILWPVDEVSPFPELIGCIARFSEPPFVVASYGLILAFDAGQSFHFGHPYISNDFHTERSNTLVDDHSRNLSLWDNFFPRARRQLSPWTYTYSVRLGRNSGFAKMVYSDGEHQLTALLYRVAEFMCLEVSFITYIYSVCESDTITNANLTWP